MIRKRNEMITGKNVLLLVLLSVFCAALGCEGNAPEDPDVDEEARDGRSDTDQVDSEADTRPDADIATDPETQPDTEPATDTVPDTSDTSSNTDTGGELDTSSDSPDIDDECAALGEADCLARSECVLELAWEGYRCRPAHNTCERQIDRDSCEIINGCSWWPGMCYCPEGAVCECEGGPPPICRQVGDPVLCRPSPPYYMICLENQVCCAELDANLGTCVARGSCELGACACLIEYQQNVISPDDMQQLVHAIPGCFTTEDPFALEREASCLPFELGIEERTGFPLEVVYFCSDVCPHYGFVLIRYIDVGADECDDLSGEAMYDPAWGGYIGCIPPDLTE